MITPIINKYTDSKSKFKINKRQQDIVNIARIDGFVSVEQLAISFNVTQQTIRRDLSFLSDHLYLARTHGGAFFQSGVSNIRHDSRQAIAQKEKAAIALRVSSIIPDNASVVLNIGTTTEEVAKNLVNTHKGLKIITNNFSSHEDFVANFSGYTLAIVFGVISEKIRIIRVRMIEPSNTFPSK